MWNIKKQFDFQEIEESIFQNENKGKKSIIRFHKKYSIVDVKVVVVVKEWYKLNLLILFWCKITTTWVVVWAQNYYFSFQDFSLSFFVWFSRMIDQTSKREKTQEFGEIKTNARSRVHMQKYVEKKRDRLDEIWISLVC